VIAFGACLALQLVLGGLVSSRYAGLACPEWPTCNGGAWFPSWEGAVGLHLLHRSNGYALGGVLLGAAFATRGAGRAGGVLRLAAGLALAQIVVGVLNVRLGLPVEVTGLHSALAAALVLCLAAAGFESFSGRRA
jgi:cytochrome c oxidase assembly protein subunit 15